LALIKAFATTAEMIQLKAFASGARDHGTMSLVAKGMTLADIKAAAIYMASAS